VCLCIKIKTTQTSGNYTIAGGRLGAWLVCVFVYMTA
jgi:hypothetical protein